MIKTYSVSFSEIWNTSGWQYKGFPGKIRNAKVPELSIHLGTRG
jgi:hypothetical protein